MAEEATVPEDEDLVLNLDEEPQKTEKTESEKTEKTAKPPPVPGPSSAPEPPPQTGLADLEKQIESVRRERDQAVAYNRQVQAERDRWAAYAQEAERRGVSAYELYADNQIQGIQDQMDALAAQQEGAFGDADWKTVSEINKRLNRLGGQLAIAERDKAVATQARERAKQQQQQQPRTQQPSQPLPTDPLERAIMGRSDRTKAFIRQHPELVRGDGSLKRVAMEAHERALDDGHAVDSEGYFRHIEATLASSKAPAQAPQEPAAAAPRAEPSYAAPASRSAPPIPGMRPDGNFQLTPKMRQLAADAGVTPQEWAANYVRLVKEGRMTPIT